MFDKVFFFDYKRCFDKVCVGFYFYLVVLKFVVYKVYLKDSVIDVLFYRFCYI